MVTISKTKTVRKKVDMEDKPYFLDIKKLVKEAKKEVLEEVEKIGIAAIIGTNRHYPSVEEKAWEKLKKRLLK